PITTRSNGVATGFTCECGVMPPIGVPDREPPGLVVLDLEHHALWLLDAIPDTYQEARRLATIDKPVVVGECEVHHRANHDLIGSNDRALVEGVHAKDAALGRV